MKFEDDIKHGAEFQNPLIIGLIHSKDWTFFETEKIHPVGI